MLRALRDPRGRVFFNDFLVRVLRRMWRRLNELFPESARMEMLAASHRKTKLAGTGFTKVTVALNNPTPLH
eukprot:5417030-Pleurochrysis_carterae.AAC.1